jgi:beta-lactamase regulating signal transducer with metallopeptidase domain
MIPYILHVTVIITVCFLFYKLLLQKETFYQLNRWTLLTCLAISFALPFLPAPHGWSWHEFDEQVLSSPALIADQPAPDPVISPVATAKPIAPTQFAAIPKPVKHTKPLTHTKPALQNKPAAPITTTTPVNPTTNSSTAAAPALTAASTTPASTIAAATPTTPIILLILHGLFYCYFFGVILLAGNFLLQIAVLWYRSKVYPAIQDGRFRIVEITGNRAPCSFGNNIFINPELYDPETYQQILIHEKIHVSGRHTLDILVAEIAVVLQWFNPFVWMYRREVENNLEFLTDRSVLLHRDVERSAYQLSLLRVTAPHLPFSITNNYNQSLLKKRIVMMNSQRSSRHTVWKYFFLLPVLTILVCALNKPAAFGQTATPATRATPATTAQPASAATAHKTTTATTLPDTTGRPASDPSGRPVIVATTATTMANAEPVVAVQVQTQVTATAEPYVTTTADPIVVDVQPGVESRSIHISANRMLKSGSWFVTTATDGKLEFELKSENDDHSWQSSFTVDKSEINPFPGQGTVEFKLVREAGTIVFKGQFDGQQGFGHFEFQPDAAYFNALKQLGVEDLDEDRQGSFFMLNIKKEYVSMLQRNGYSPIQEHEVISLSAMHIDKAYVEDLKAAGFDHLAVHQLVSLKAQHIDGHYVRSMAAGSVTPVTPEELISFRAMRIDSGYLTSLKGVGYDHLDRHEIMSFQSMHITADFIKGFQDAGFKDIPPHTLISLKAMGVTADYAKSFRDLGYSDLEPNRLTSLKAMGITPEYVKSFNKIGFDNIPVSTLTSLKATGVTADYVAKMKEKGLDSKDLNKYMQLKREFN